MSLASRVLYLNSGSCDNFLVMSFPIVTYISYSVHVYLCNPSFYNAVKYVSFITYLSYANEIRTNSPTVVTDINFRKKEFVEVTRYRSKNRLQIIVVSSTDFFLFFLLI